ncbi:Origin recognition complex subunit 6 [Citrus sinensis]|nr:Origin recognition complex subunit 6 [Citrus sinensis]
MDLSDIAKKLGLSDSKQLIRKAAEIRRLCDVQFDSSIIGVGEVCKAVICLELAASRFDVIFDRKTAIKLSGMSEKAYNRSFNSLQNSIGFKNELDIRELGIRFGCIRLIPLVQKGLSLFKDRFTAALPASRKTSADFSRPVFTAVAFYLCAKKHKLKVDKLKLIEVCGTSETEFASVKLLDVLPEKRKFEDVEYLSADEAEVSSYKRHKKTEKVAYEEWKTSVLASNRNKAKAPCKRTTQAGLNFQKKAPETPKLEAV